MVVAKVTTMSPFPVVEGLVALLGLDASVFVSVALSALAALRRPDVAVFPSSVCRDVVLDFIRCASCSVVKSANWLFTKEAAPVAIAAAIEVPLK
ncbi:hypothetical protein D3C71_900860 [compost metagenome]